MTLQITDERGAAGSPGATRSAPPRPGRRSARRRLTLRSYAMLAPAIVLFLAFLAAPIVYTVVLSFQKVTVEGLGLGPDSRKIVFAGFENYVTAVGDPQLWSSVARVLLYGVIVVPTVLILALVLALLLDSMRTRARRFSRIVIFLPYAVPGVISSVLWGFLYLPAVSPFTYVFQAVGLTYPNPLDGAMPVLLSIANIALWGGVGFNMLVIYTSLRAIPTDIYEAARLDGASEVQVALRIKVPIVVPSLIMTSLFGVVATLQIFAEPTVLRPLTNYIPTSWSPLMKVYRDAFINNDLYSAAATSVLIAVATIVLSSVFLRVVQRRAFAQED